MAPGVAADVLALPGLAQSAPAQPTPRVPSAPQASPSAAARQLAPALVQIAHGPSGNSVTLRLDPAELGHVLVRVERDPAGAATVQITAERPETLHLLKTDQPQLHRALDSAGLPAEGRTLAFSLQQQSSSDHQTSAAAPGGGQFDGAGGSGTGRHATPGRQGRAATLFGATAEDPGPGEPIGWVRAGVDITA